MPSTSVHGVHVDYLDTGGEGPVIVLLHGIHMNAEIWHDVIAELAEYRCLAPTLPLGAHERPVPPETDLSLAGLASLVAGLLSELGLQKPTLVGNDTGGAVLQSLAATRPEVIGRLALVSCEAFDNMPPGLPGAVDRVTARIPGGHWMAAQSMRVPGFSSLPFTFGRMSKRRVPPELTTAWFEPLRRNAGVRRDFVRLVRSLTARDMESASREIDRFTGPAAVIWGRADRVMPLEHATRLASALGVDVTLIDDSATLVPLDQPVALANALRSLHTE